MRGFTSEIFLNEVDQRAPAPGAQSADRRLQPARRGARPATTRRATTCTPISTRRWPASGRASWRWPRRAPPAASKAARSGRRPSPTHAPAQRTARQRPSHGHAASPPRPTMSCARSSRTALIEALGLTLGALRQDLGAGDRQSGSERRGLPEAPGARRITASTSELKLVESENNRALEQARTRARRTITPTIRTRSSCCRDERAEIAQAAAGPDPAAGGRTDSTAWSARSRKRQAENRLSEDEDVLLKRLRQLKDDLDSMDWTMRPHGARVHRQIEPPQRRRPAQLLRRRRHRRRASTEAVSGPPTETRARHGPARVFI